MSAELDDVLSDIVKIVSYVNANVLDSSLFSLLCGAVKDMKLIIRNSFYMLSFNDYWRKCSIEHVWTKETQTFCKRNSFFSSILKLWIGQ